MLNGLKFRILKISALNISPASTAWYKPHANRIYITWANLDLCTDERFTTAAFAQSSFFSFLVTDTLPMNLHLKIVLLSKFADASEFELSKVVQVFWQKSL